MRTPEENAEHEVELIEQDDSLSPEEKRREIREVYRTLKAIENNDY